MTLHSFHFFFIFDGFPYRVLHVLTRPQTASGGQQLILLQADDSVVLCHVPVVQAQAGADG